MKFTKKIFSILIMLSICTFTFTKLTYTQTENKITIKAKKVYADGGQKIRIDKEKNIYILNMMRHDITVLDLNFKFTRRIGGIGQGPGEFKVPTDFDINEKGDLFIIDYFNFRMQVLNEFGEQKYEKAINKTSYSISTSKNNGVYINNSKNKYLFDYLDLTTNKIDSYGNHRKVPWLFNIINDVITNDSERKKIINSYQSLLNQAIIRTDRFNNIYLLFVTSPLIRKYNVKGELILEKPFLQTKLDTVINKAKNKIKSNIIKGEFGISIINQDFYISPLEGNIYITITNKTSLLVLDQNFNYNKEICLVDMNNKPIGTSTISYNNNGQWIATNNSGTYLFNSIY